MSGSASDERSRAVGEVLDRGGDVERAAAVAQQPARRALDEPARLEQHLRLRLRGDPVVERLDVRPERAHVEDLARDGVGAGDVRGGAPVSSSMRKANVDPARSTMLFVTCVAMISRRSRCRSICSAKRSGSGAGK